jgi:hypothetical protein
MKHLPPFLKWPASDVFKEKIQAAFSSSVEKELVIFFSVHTRRSEKQRFPTSMLRWRSLQLSVLMPRTKRNLKKFLRNERSWHDLRMSHKPYGAQRYRF